MYAEETEKVLCVASVDLLRSQWDPGTELAVKLCGHGKIEEFFNPEILT